MNHCGRPTCECYGFVVKAERERLVGEVGKLKNLWADADGGGGRTGYNAALDAVLSLLRGGEIKS